MRLGPAGGGQSPSCASSPMRLRLLVGPDGAAATEASHDYLGERRLSDATKVAS